MARSTDRKIAISMVPGLAHASRYRIPLSLSFVAGIQDVPQSKYNAVTTNLTANTIRESFSVLSAVLPIVPTLPTVIQEAFEDALKEAVEAQEDGHFNQLYNALIKEAANRRRLEAELERLCEENAILKEQVRRGTKRPRDEMDGHQQQQQHQDGEGGADQQDKRPRGEDTKTTT